jgi:outer membrane receptor protein involved in Fe transport
MSRQFRNIVSLFIGAALVALLPQVGLAQIEEIVVTARKKAENIQDIPLAITAFDAETIQRKGINNIADLAKNTAGLVFDSGITSQDTRVVIRGLSPTRGRQNIAFLQDNIDISSEAISTAGGSLLVNPRYLDFERIEVLKGPQSALYGRAAFNGAINYVTKDPGDEFEFDILADANNASGSDNNEYSITAAGGGPVTDTFGLRASGSYWNEDGYYNNPFTSPDNLGGGDGFGLSLKGVWQPADEISVKLRVAYSDDHYEQRPAAFLEYNQLSFLPTEAITRMWVTEEFTGDPDNPDQVADFNFYRYDVCGPSQLNDGTPGDNPITAATDCAQNSDTTRIADGRVKSPLFTAPVAAFRGKIPDTDELNIRLSPDPRSIDPNGINKPDDYPGTDMDVFRGSLEFDWQVLNGTVTSWTGYTTANQDVRIDFDKYAANPDDLHAALIQSDTGPGADGVLGTDDDIFCSLSGGDCAWGTQQIDFSTDTDQFSEEIRYSSDLDGAINYTVGGMFWYEDTKQEEFSTTARASDGIFPFVGSDEFIPAMGSTRPNCYSAEAGPAAGVAMQAFMPDWEDYLRPAGPPGPPLSEEQFTGILGLRGPEGVSIPIGFNMLCPPSGSDILQYLDDRAIIQSRDKEAETKHYSFYAMTDFELSEAWTLSLEGRYTNEREEQTQPILDPADPEFNVRQSPSSIQPNCGTSPDSPMPPQDGEVDGNVCGPSIPADTPETGPWRTPDTLGTTVATRTSFFTPRAALEWRPADNQMYYLSYAVGKKPGGFSRLTGGSGGFEPREAEYDEETLDVYELGAKTTLFNNRLMLNSAFYYQDFDDKQVPTTQINFQTGLSTAAVENAGSAEIWGFELEAQWAPTDRLNFGLAYNYLDAEYVDFKIKSSSLNDLTRNSSEIYRSSDPIVGNGDYRVGNSCPLGAISARAAIDGQSGAVVPDMLCEIDLSGNTLEDVPKHSLNLNAMYTAPLLDTGAEWYIEGEYVFQDERFLEQSNDSWVDSYYIVDARIGLMTDSWTATFYVENVFEDETVRSAQTGPGISTGLFINGPPRVRNQVIAYPAPPRVFGLRLQYKFGS